VPGRARPPSPDRPADSKTRALGPDEGSRTKRTSSPDRVRRGHPSPVAQPKRSAPGASEESAPDGRPARAEGTAAANMTVGQPQHSPASRARSDPARQRRPVRPKAGGRSRDGRQSGRRPAAAHETIGRCTEIPHPGARSTGQMLKDRRAAFGRYRPTIMLAAADLRSDWPTVFVSRPPPFGWAGRADVISC